MAGCDGHAEEIYRAIARKKSTVGGKIDSDRHYHAGLLRGREASSWVAGSIRGTGARPWHHSRVNLSVFVKPVSLIRVVWDDGLIRLVAVGAVLQCICRFGQGIFGIYTHKSERSHHKHQNHGKHNHIFCDALTRLARPNVMDYSLQCGSPRGAHPEMDPVTLRGRTPPSARGSAQHKRCSQSATCVRSNNC